MKVLQSGLTRNWEPPKTVTCSTCKAVLGEITLADVQVGERTESDQRESWKVNYAFLKCPECFRENPITFPSLLLHEKIANNKAEWERIRNARIAVDNDSRDRSVLPLRMGVDR